MASYGFCFAQSLNFVSSISPSLLEELKNSTEPVPKKLDALAAKSEGNLPKVSFVDDEPAFRWALLEDQMAFEKLHEGIRKFALDGQAVKDVLKAKLGA